MGSAVPCLPDTNDVPVRLYASGNELRSQLLLSADAGNGASIKDDGLWVPGGADSLMVVGHSEINTGTVNDSSLARPAYISMTVTNPSATLDAYLFVTVWTRNLTFRLWPGQTVLYFIQAQLNGTGVVQLQPVRCYHGGLAFPEDPAPWKDFNPGGYAGYGPVLLAGGGEAVLEFWLQRYSTNGGSDQINGLPTLEESGAGQQLYALATLTTTPRDIV